MKYNVPARLAGLVLAAAFLVGTAGCGSKPTGQVSGKVAYRGKILSGWEVQLYSKTNGVGATGSLDSAGRFTIADPLPTGTYEVYLTPPAPPPPPPNPEGSAAPKPAQPIPPKYTDARTSGLSYPVEIGPNEMLIELKDN